MYAAQLTAMLKNGLRLPTQRLHHTFLSDFTLASDYFSQLYKLWYIHYIINHKS
jgi:hypothetical protein